MRIIGRRMLLRKENYEKKWLGAKIIGDTV